MRTFLNFELHSEEWGVVKLSRVVPSRDDIWGAVAPLRGTPWGDEIVTVNGEDLSNALHHHVVPLVRSLGVPPHVHLKRIPEEWCTCAMFDGCINYDPAKCRPCPELPDCYTPPGLGGDAELLAAHVALAWRDGRYVIAVEGDEFTM